MFNHSQVILGNNKTSALKKTVNSITCCSNGYQIVTSFVKYRTTMFNVLKQIYDSQRTIYK